MKLQEKVAIVTGAGRNIGEAISKLFAQEGAEVIVADINKERADKVARDINQSGFKALAVHIDATGIVEAPLAAAARLDLTDERLGEERS